MTAERPDYDVLFADQMMRALNADPDPDPQKCAGIPDELKNFGFFGFCRRKKYYGEPHLTSVLNQVMKELSISDPALAAQILEDEFQAVGIRRAAELVNLCDIPYRVKHLLGTLKSIVPDMEKRYSKEELENLQIDSNDFVTQLSYRNVPFRLYPDLIFSAETPEELELIRRLFINRPAEDIGYKLLRFHKDFNQKNFDLLTPSVQSAQNQQWRVSTRAISLALQGQLNVQKLVETEKPDRPQWSANLQLAQLCGQDLSGVVFSGFGECLTECVLNSEVACGLMLGVIQEHLDATPYEHRSEALVTQLFAVRKALNNLTILVNHEMAINLFWVMVSYAHQDARPLLAILECCSTFNQTESDSTKSRDNKFCMMLKYALFNTPKTLAAVDVLGLFGRHALNRLLHSGVALVTPAGEVNFNSPNIKAYEPELKQAVAAFALKCLTNNHLSHDSAISSHEAQSMVDAELFSEQDWLWISSNTTAATNIALAQLPTNILEIVGDQVLEMALGNALGL